MNAQLPPLSPAGEAALTYATRGWHVLPSPRGKKLGFAEFAMEHTGRRWGATDDPDELRRMFTLKPDADVCITTGPDSGLFVIEGDNKNGVNGIKWLADQFRDHGGEPETIQALSPSSSWHFYFKWSKEKVPKTEAGKVAPGVDVRGHGGMVVAAPSIRPGSPQPYRWKAPPDEFELLDCPDWLLEKVPMVETKGRTTKGSIATGGGDYAKRVAELAVDGTPASLAWAWYTSPSRSAPATTSETKSSMSSPSSKPASARRARASSRSRSQDRSAR
ncbi:MAG: bifunctional DNA primase/polymerase [Paracoccaceae bacterium]